MTEQEIYKQLDALNELEGLLSRALRITEDDYPDIYGGVWSAWSRYDDRYSELTRELDKLHKQE